MDRLIGRNLAESIAREIHTMARVERDADRQPGLAQCFVDDDSGQHLPCSATGLRIGRVLEDQGWRQTPSDNFNEGLRQGRLEGLEAGVAASPEELHRMSERVRQRDPNWRPLGHIRALDGP